MTLDDSMVDLKVAVDNACATIDVLRARLARRDALLRRWLNTVEIENRLCAETKDELGDSHE